MPTDPLKITGEDLGIIQETLRTGDLNIFTSQYMWLVGFALAQWWR